MNSAGAIRADGHARVQIGDSYSTIHNYLDSSHYRPDSHSAETDNAKLRTEFLRRLYTSPYEDRKNRNPKRAYGTCEWFTAHRLFQNCACRITCYFFFKDDFDDQRVLEGALCCILHQLFTQKSILLSDEILEDFREEGDQLFTSFSKLWDILMRATRNHNEGEIVCILDALDECVDQIHLARALTQHYSKGKGISTLKFLVTSRPYLRIQRDFQELKESQPTIHLSGESQEEVDKIAQEITISIKQRTEELCKRLHLSIEERQILDDELATARKILHIIVAADRPLHLIEMAVALAFRRESHQCHEDLERDLLSPDRLQIAIRETCGLFIVIQDSQVFLLHQTAREFLVRLSPKSSGLRSLSLEWQQTLDLKESHLLLSEICIGYLLLADFKTMVGDGMPRRPDDRDGFVFLDYAASNWADHYRQAHNTLGTDLERLAFQLCETEKRLSLSWLKVYGEKRIQDPEFFRELGTPLLIASYFGLHNLVNIILQEHKTSLNMGGAFNERTALSWASEKGYGLIVQSLLNQVPKHQVIIRDSFLLFLETIVNRTDRLGRSPLWYSVANGHYIIVQHLLKKGAKVDARDKNGLTPLSWATHHGYGDIVALLLESGARRNSQSNHPEIRDRRGRTPLLKAAGDGNEVVVQLLLDRGAKVDASDEGGCTALMSASEMGDDAIVKLLLDHEAKVDVSDTDRCTALMYAADKGQDTIIKLLLERGAKVNGSDKEGWTALMYASNRGDNEAVELLLDRGAKVNAKNKNRKTALMYASNKGHDAIVKLLLGRGTKVDALDEDGRTALMLASDKGYDAIVKLLRDKGARR
ncbi:hypothetical protein CIB48_g10197 [Xylaria polymorpha]|nr:hypothetical protein CIB48_g10197 [Xylaria polymorpha]